MRHGVAEGVFDHALEQRARERAGIAEQQQPPGWSTVVTDRSRTEADAARM